MRKKIDDLLYRFLFAMIFYLYFKKKRKNEMKKNYHYDNGY